MLYFFARYLEAPDKFNPALIKSFNSVFNDKTVFSLNNYATREFPIFPVHKSRRRESAVPMELPKVSCTPSTKAFAHP